MFGSKITCFYLRLCSTLPSVFIKGNNMKMKIEFEKVCSMMLGDRWSFNGMPEMTMEVENKFYENFGMSAQEINEVFSGRKHMN